MKLKDPQKAAEYLRDVQTFMKRAEGVNSATFGYMELQQEVSERMRAILVDWLIEVHFKFKLFPETLFLTINLLDRFMAKVQVSKDQLQLVGITAMLLASKYEEIYAPEISDFTYITDNAVSAEEIREMERHMVTALDFDFQTQSSL